MLRESSIFSFALGKSLCLSLEPIGHKTSAPFELIFSDVQDPPMGFLLMVFITLLSFINAYPKHIWYYPIIAKSDVFSTFHRFQTLVER